MQKSVIAILRASRDSKTDCCILMFTGQKSNCLSFWPKLNNCSFQNFISSGIIIVLFSVCDERRDFIVETEHIILNAKQKNDTRPLNPSLSWN